MRLALSPCWEITILVQTGVKLCLKPPERWDLCMRLWDLVSLCWTFPPSLEGKHCCSQQAELGTSVPLSLLCEGSKSCF